MSVCGIDVGSYNLVSCRRNKDNNFEFIKEVNAFIKIPLDNPFVFNMIKSSEWKDEKGRIIKVPIIERENIGYILGEAAVQMAYSFGNIDLHRPMSSGCVNPKEIDAFQILNIMLHSMINAKQDGEPLCYCIPAESMNTEEIDINYHQKILESIFKSYRSEEGYKVNPIFINEALALIYSELSLKGFSGIGISFGSGLINACYSLFSNPLIKFSINNNSGDWIDRQVAKATGESPSFVNIEKTKISLSKPGNTLMERAIKTQYEIMIEKAIQGLQKGFANLKGGQIGKEADCVVAGGVSSPEGFVELFEEALNKAKLPLKIGKIFRPEDPLLSVARGCCLAAEASKKG